VAGAFWQRSKKLSGIASEQAKAAAQRELLAKVVLSVDEAFPHRTAKQKEIMAEIQEEDASALVDEIKTELEL
jgi:hypothetical protein